MVWLSRCRLQPPGRQRVLPSFQLLDHPHGYSATSIAVWQYQLTRVAQKLPFCIQAVQKKCFPHGFHHLPWPSSAKCQFLPGLFSSTAAAAFAAAFLLLFAFPWPKTNHTTSRGSKTTTWDMGTHISNSGAMEKAMFNAEMIYTWVIFFGHVKE